MMKRLFCLLVVMMVATMGLRADEGMWLLPLLQKMNADAMAQAGCRLTPEQIYSINNSSLKDAVVQFGGGCTGEMISDEGLLVTNHHCGYGSIQKLSSVEHNYLADGYWAMTRSEELPCAGLSVTFLVSIEDVTDECVKAREKAERAYKDDPDCGEKVRRSVKDKIEEIVKKSDEALPYCKSEVQTYYDENVYYLLVYKVYNDVRFVGAPPSSIGKFGADTDNWMWPRHTGDFSMFRVYADKDNNPAEYSPENVPYKPAQSLKISLKGMQEGDFAMIMGYPGSTSRFQTATQLRQMLQQNDVRIAARTVRQEVMLEDMLADPAVKIQYASKYSGSTNGWKKWQGMKLAFANLEIIDRKEAEEADYEEWVASSKKRSARYEGVLDSIGVISTTLNEPYLKQILLSESVARIEIVSFAGRIPVGADSAAVAKGLSMLEGMYKDYSAETDRKVAKAMLRFYRDNAAPEDYCITGLADLDIDAYVDEMFEKSAFTSLEKLKAALGSGASLEKDLAVVLNADVMRAAGVYSKAVRDGRQSLKYWQRLYTEAQMEWKKGEPSYPDANFTMRLTYGNVKSYSPADAVIYKYYTTLDGVMEKEDPDNWEFVVPARLKELWKAGDFGDYAREDGRMPVAFLTNNDITGGNSGSPVLNADGELLGLAFDGNWESMSSDVMFEPDLQRCICVDIRYVLFIMDKFGGAAYLLDEMNLVK